LRRRLLAGLAGVIALIPLTVSADWATYHADNSRTGTDATQHLGSPVELDWETSARGAVSWGPNRIDVFARGADNQLWERTFG
jgi:hypothetical protein